MTVLFCLHEFIRCFQTKQGSMNTAESKREADYEDLIVIAKEFSNVK